MIKASVVKVKEMNRKELLNSIQKYLFYAVELNLYLDNHPEMIKEFINNTHNE